MDKFINKLIMGDCLEVLKQLEDNSIDAIVTDPPYELGFMGKSWDNTGIANNKEMWAECLRVLKPGGHLLAFSGTRTYHRMASAIEDAGFEVRDMIEWVYGSGFPKSLNIGKAVDKLGGRCLGQEIGNIIKQKRIELGYSTIKLAEIGGFYGKTNHGGTVSNWETGNGSITPEQFNKLIEILGLENEPVIANERELLGKSKFGASSIYGSEIYHNRENEKEIDITKGTSEWEGWGTALKPSHEPICMARKPLAEKTVAENCLKWGTGGINIDESRVEANQGEYDIRHYTKEDCFQNKVPKKSQFQVKPQPIGRFPANLIHDNSEEVRECFPETGKSRSGGKGKPLLLGEGLKDETTIQERGGYDDNGGNASRFFKSIMTEEKNCSIVINCALCGKPKKIRASLKRERNYCSLDCARKGHSKFSSQNVACSYCGKEFVKKNSQMFTDKHFCSRGCMGEWQSKFLLGENSYNWKDGKMDLISRIRSLKKMIDWRNEVYKRDDYTCQKCGDNTGGNLEAHHKNHLSDLIRELNLNDITDAIESQELWDIENGITLCDDCHIETHKTESKKSVLYFAKASKAERNRGCEELEEKVGIRTNAPRENEDIKTPTRTNNHPTVKPIALMEYLIKMVTPKGGLVLDPFAGSGSTLVAAKQNGFQYIGIERDPDYMKIAEARINNSKVQIKLI